MSAAGPGRTPSWLRGLRERGRDYLVPAAISMLGAAFVALGALVGQQPVLVVGLTEVAAGAVGAVLVALRRSGQNRRRR